MKEILRIPGALVLISVCLTDLMAVLQGHEGDTRIPGALVLISVCLTDLMAVLQGREGDTTDPWSTRLPLSVQPT